MDLGHASIVRTLLRSTPVRRLRSGLRDARWAIMGRNYQNPSLPLEAASVLFVCMGNICRSPFAAQLAAHRFRHAGLRHVRCESAGISATPLDPPPKGAILAARARGVPIDAHRATLLTGELVESHDVIVVMEPAHIDTLRRRWPHRRAHYFLLSLFTADDEAGAFDRYHIADPFGRPQAEFHDCYGRISVAVAQLVTGWPNRPA